MNTRKSSTIAAGLLASTLFVVSPVLMAGNQSSHHGDGQYGDQRNITELCENLREGKGHFNKTERQAEMIKRREAMAERLKLTEEQRGIWNEIHGERRQKHEKRMGKWQDKMKKRCAESQK